MCTIKNILKYRIKRLTCIILYGIVIKLNSYRGVEQGKLVGLITRRSLVQIQPPQPKKEATQSGCFLFLLPCVVCAARPSGYTDELRSLG